MLEAVVVSVNYADFLAWTLPFNKPQFDSMVVVTSTTDKQTQKLCEYWHIKCVKVDIQEAEGFPKGKLINAGLNSIKGTDWCVHMDSDIYLPPHFRRMFDAMKLDQDSIYSMDRMMCQSYSDWISYLSNPTVQHENDIFVHPGPFPMGVRLSSAVRNGWIPIGYFQGWHQGSKKLVYPEEHLSAARGDMQFTLKFPRDKRQMIAECICIHLETQLPENANMGQNWNGRKTPQFNLDSILNQKI